VAVSCLRSLVQRCRNHSVGTLQLTDSMNGRLAYIGPSQLPYTEPISDGFLRVTSTEDKQVADC